jgi:flavodoxin
MEQGTLIRAPKHGDFLFKGVGRFKVEETRWEEYYTAKGVVETGKALRNFATTKRNESLEIYSLKKITKKIMKKTLVVFGSSTGTLEGIAEDIASKLGADVKNVSEIDAALLEEYDNLLLGSSTWGAGEVQDDWYDGLEVLKQANLAGKTIALYGCGDAESYGDTFCGALIELYNAVVNSGAKLVGAVDASTYNYVESEAVIDGKFVGLALDVNEDNSERIANWLEEIKGELA